MQNAGKVEDVFDKLLALRGRIAANAGFSSYRDFMFRELNRFDYGPEDCFAFHDAVEKHMVPLAARLADEKRGSLGLDTLRPWDLAVDPLNRQPLRPFKDIAEFMCKTETVFGLIDPDLAALFRYMREGRLLDLENRKAKAPGGYQYTLPESRVSFIFMNAVGTADDVRTLVHEGGHALHSFLAREEPVVEYWAGDYNIMQTEFAEVASQTMEFLALAHVQPFYPNHEDLNRFYRGQLEDTIIALRWIATIDAFQHWIYTSPGHSREERQEAWARIFSRFQPEVDWSGLEEMLASCWYCQLHLFEVPFYYIEYGISLLGALQIWLNSKKNYRETVERYKYALSLGGSRPLPELFEAAGAEFPLGPNCDRIVAAAAKTLEEELEKNPL
jgi:oligoendopeptidase F